jgi:NAD(P)-dependent dehydrogenase (short-subunit alcohol dehydrogenase family)
MRPLTDQTILVTGATAGHGRALADKLAAEGANVIRHSRADADFSSLDEVLQYADRIFSENDRLDVLVNNAGIGTEGPREESRDGYELRFAVNYLAGVLLTRELLPLILLTGPPARIVNVSSAGQAAIDFDDVMLERSYSGVQAYGQSKLAQVMITFDLAEGLGDSGFTANCLHPATFMPTKMVRDAGVTPTSSLDEGVEATFRLVADPELDGVNGRYFNGLHESRAHPQAYDREARRALSELTERITDRWQQPEEVS